MQSLAYLKPARKLFFKKGVLPEQVTFFVTPQCNARCKHCFAWKALNDSKETILSLSEVEKISKSMGRFTYLLLGGGEPFLRNDLAEIVNIFYKNSGVLNVAISTNGSLPEAAINTARRILRGFKNSLTVNVSFDAIGRAHDEIRQLPGIFEKAVQTYRMLKDLKMEYPALNAGIIMTCMPYNYEAISETYLWLKKNLKPYSIVMNYMRGDVRDKEAMPKSALSAYGEIMSMIEKDNLCQDIPGHENFFLSEFNLASKMLMRKIVSDTVKENTFQLPCFAGILNCVLWYNGDVYPCEMLDKKMGALRENSYDFKKIWRSQEAQEIRRFIKKGRCFCTEECNINMNVLFNLRYLPRLLWKAAKIKTGRRMNRLRK